MKSYNIIYLTDIPSFYKVNLLNKIAEKRNLLVIFLHDISPNRNNDFYNGDRKFDWISFAEESVPCQIIKLSKLLRKTEYNSLIICGWRYSIFWFSAFISPKWKNSVVVESSINESKTEGLKGNIKRIFLSRISKSYVPGKSQELLLKNLSFKGEIIITKGVGIFRIQEQPVYYSKNEVKNFIFVGRLSPEKNLEYLIRTFNDFPDLTLNIIGFGPLEMQLKKIAMRNTKFFGAVGNSSLPDYYRKNDALILPSISEVWGLVVEEALNNGLPVIISEKVGCGSEIIVPDYNGIIFSLSETRSLEEAILKMLDIRYYNSLRYNISRMDFNKVVQHQVDCYL
ncbi:MAG: glycosyltransferase family 4 protein [Bacteroidales bacterium]|nr:glycosyltransferase family 4 protein [Bacteroidales bacterium]